MSESNPNAWTTAVTEIKPNRVAVRGYDIAELMGNVTFGQAVYLILRGERGTGRSTVAVFPWPCGPDSTALSS